MPSAAKSLMRMDDGVAVATGQGVGEGTGVGVALAAAIVCRWIRLGVAVKSGSVAGVI